MLPYGDASSNSVGMLASDESAEWLWERKLALVGADNPAFEALPFNGTIGGVARSLHQVFIGGESYFLLAFRRCLWKSCEQC